MRIKALSFHDRTKNWEIDVDRFDPSLNLMVGISGAGKTTLIRALMLIFATAQGRTLLRHVAWTLNFTLQDQEYCWHLETDLSTGDMLAEQNEQYDISLESLDKLTASQPEQIFLRQGSSLVLNGQQAPKVKKTESILNLFSEEDLILPIHGAFKRFNFQDSAVTKVLRLPFDPANLEAPESLDAFKVSSLRLPMMMKLLMIERHFPAVHAQIKEAYTEIFPQVSDLRVEVNTHQQGDYSLMLAIQVVEQEDWIRQTDISAGMFKTLVLLVNVMTAPDETVVAMDEFENSLGINCIGEVMDIILEQCPRLQFILTSHHPYIINNVPWQQWSIISREQDVIKVYPATEVQALQTSSSLDRFSQLIEVLDSLSPAH